MPCEASARFSNSATKRRAKRVENHRERGVAKARLEPEPEKPACPMRTRGAVRRTQERAHRRAEAQLRTSRTRRCAGWGPKATAGALLKGGSAHRGRAFSVAPPREEPERDEDGARQAAP